MIYAREDGRTSLPNMWRLYAQDGVPLEIVFGVYDRGAAIAWVPFFEDAARGGVRAFNIVQEGLVDALGRDAAEAEIRVMTKELITFKMSGAVYDPKAYE